MQIHLETGRYTRAAVPFFKSHVTTMIQTDIDTSMLHISPEFDGSGFISTDLTVER